MEPTVVRGARPFDRKSVRGGGSLIRSLALTLWKAPGRLRAGNVYPHPFPRLCTNLPGARRRAKDRATFVRGRATQGRRPSHDRGAAQVRSCPSVAPPPSAGERGPPVLKTKASRAAAPRTVLGEWTAARDAPAQQPWERTWESARSRRGHVDVDRGRAAAPTTTHRPPGACILAHGWCFQRTTAGRHRRALKA